MISEWLLGTLLDSAKNGIIAGISKIDLETFDSILDKTLRELESRYFGLSRTNFKDFIKSSEFQTHLEHHLIDKDLDLEYLGEILSEYVNLKEGISAQMLWTDFLNTFEINLSKDPKLKALLDLRYHKSTEHKLQNIEELMNKNHDEVMELLECVIQKDVQKSDRKFCFQGQEVSDDQIIKLATNALQKAKSKYEKGLSLTVLGKFEEAKLQFDNAIEHNPQCAECYSARGNTRLIQDKSREAYEDYSEAIHLNPKYTPAWINIAIALDNLDRYEDALEASNKALELDRKNVLALSNKAFSLNSLGRHEEALKASNEALD